MTLLSFVENLPSIRRGPARLDVPQPVLVPHFLRTKLGPSVVQIPEPVRVVGDLRDFRLGHWLDLLRVAPYPLAAAPVPLEASQDDAVIPLLHPHPLRLRVLLEVAGSVHSDPPVVEQGQSGD